MLKILNKTRKVSEQNVRTKTNYDNIFALLLAAAWELSQSFLI